MDINLKKDLLASNTIAQKCINNNIYAQNLYAAMANNLFYKNNEEWSCSWRYAGGVLADIRDVGESYMDWYCSGIKDSKELDDAEFQSLTKEQQESYIQGKAFVPESCVTDEIREDLLKLGWIVLDDEDSDV